MQAKIGTQLLATLKPQSTAFEVNDIELRGFILRVQPTGALTYICAYRLRGSGRRDRITIGRPPVLSPAQARDEARKILGDVARGLDPKDAFRAQRKAARKPTLQQYIDDTYATWAQAHLADARDTLRRIKAAFPELLPKKLDDINAWTLDKWKAQRARSGIKATTINRDLIALRAALSKAVQWELIDAHPMRKVKAVKVEQDSRVRFLSDDEDARLHQALDRREGRVRLERNSANQWRRERGYEELPELRSAAFVDHLKPMVLLSINTGLRRGELFQLQWGDIDFRQCQLKVRGAVSKNRKARHVPLNEEALSVLSGWQNQQANTDGFVFPGKDGKPLDNVKHAWQKLAAEAGLRDFRWHDLRHHFASRLVMAGVDLNTVRELLGHGDIKMTLRYAHLAPEHKAAAVAKLVRAA